MELNGAEMLTLELSSKGEGVVEGTAGRRGERGSSHQPEQEEVPETKHHLQALTRG